MSFTRNPKLIYAICAVLWAVVAWNLATRESEPYERVASSDALNSYAKATLRDVQSRSIANNQEYCGVIYEDDQGKLFTSKIYEGDHATCEFDWGVPLGNHVVASFHTHAGYDPEYDSELPSQLDMANDIDARIEGYIATPAGRIWHIDWKTETASQLCGIKCIGNDPNYRELKDLPVRRSYTVKELDAELNGTGGGNAAD